MENGLDIMKSTFSIMQDTIKVTEENRLKLMLKGMYKSINRFFKNIFRNDEVFKGELGPYKYVIKAKDDTVNLETLELSVYDNDGKVKYYWGRKPIIPKKRNK